MPPVGVTLVNRLVTLRAPPNDKFPSAEENVARTEEDIIYCATARPRDFFFLFKTADCAPRETLRETHLNGVRTTSNERLIIGNTTRINGRKWETTPSLWRRFGDDFSTIKKILDAAPRALLLTMNLRRTCVTRISSKRFRLSAVRPCSTARVFFG